MMKKTINKKRKIFFMGILMIAIFSISACTEQVAVEPQVVIATMDVDALAEEIAAAVISEITQEAETIAFVEAAAPTATTLPTESPTATPTEIPEPTATEEVLPTNTSTPEPTATTASVTTSQGCIYVASFNSDVTVAAGTTYEPGTAFTKTWRITNLGTCSWHTEFKIFFASGDQMSGPDSTNINTGTVAPGESADISINLHAPDDEGTYTGYWMLQTDMGETFGLGASGKALSVNIVVSDD